MFVWIRDFRNKDILKNLLVYGFANHRQAYNFILVLCCMLAGVPEKTNLFIEQGRFEVDNGNLGPLGGIDTKPLNDNEMLKRIDDEVTIAYFHRVQILMVKKLPSLEACENETLAIVIPYEKIKEFL